jgi:hypothetical protein
LKDYVKEFAQNEKEIVGYINDRHKSYSQSKCKRLLLERIDRLNSSWDMEVPGLSKTKRGSQSQFLAQISYPLVKEQMLVRRSIFTSNFRADPLFTPRAIGNTPLENAMNIHDLLEGNNEQIKFRPNVLRPSIDMVSKWGVNIIYTEYCMDQVMGWRTISDPLYGSKRIYGSVKNTKNAACYSLDVRNYFQNPNIVSCDDSDFKGHFERRSLAWIINRAKQMPDLYIKENIEKLIKEVKRQHGVRDQDYIDPQGKQSAGDYDKIYVNDISRGQYQIHLDGNEDDDTYYYVEKCGDIIIRFQDNPYDINMNQYTVLTCEPRYEYFWGNTPAESSIQNENSLNLLMAMGLENAIEAMNKHVFFNKNAIDERRFMNAAHNARIPVDVAKDINLNNVLFAYQPQDTAGPAQDMAYRRIMENNQRVSTSPDLNRPTSSGGPANKTAYAADIMASIGNTQDADILEQYSNCLSQVAEKQIIILCQYLGNFGPVLIRPSQSQSVREVQKANITGNYQIYMETALQRSYQGEISRYQNMVTWLLNLVNSGVPIKPEFTTMIKQVLKMGKTFKTDEILPEQQAMNAQAGYVPTQIQPGQELAGAGQEVPQAEMVAA